MLKKSVAIIGEGETEWFYLESLRVAKRYPFQMKPTFPKHSDWRYIFQQAKSCLSEGYDVVICLIDMDAMHSKPTEMPIYQKDKTGVQKDGIVVIETNPCTEFWFLLHFLPTLSTKTYLAYDDLEKDLRKYLPGYKKTKRYFKKTPLYPYLKEHGDLSRATAYAKQLLAIAQKTPEDLHSYTQIHELLERLEELGTSK